MKNDWEPMGPNHDDGKWSVTRFARHLVEVNVHKCNTREEAEQLAAELNTKERRRDAAQDMHDLLWKIARAIPYIPSVGTGRPIEVYLEVPVCQELQQLLDRLNPVLAETN